MNTCTLRILGHSPLAMSALLIAKARGFSVQWVSSEAPTNQPDNRCWSLIPKTRALLDSIGITPAQSAPVTQMEIWHADAHGHALPGALDFQGAPLTTIVPNHSLREALRSSLDGHGIVPTLTPLETLPEAPQSLTLVCDPHWARAFPRGAPASRWRYGQSALSAPVRLAQPHGGIARQVFLPTGPLALLPLPSAHAASIVWSLRDTAVAGVRAHPQLSAKVSDLLGLELRLDTQDLTQFPLQAFHSGSYGAPGHVLLGEAAHRIHPLAGMGLNLGFADLAALFDVLTQARRTGTDLCSDGVIADYQRVRWAQNEAMLAMTDQLNTLFGAQNGPARLLRSLGLQAAAASPMKDRLMTWMTGT